MRIAQMQGWEDVLYSHPSICVYFWAIKFKIKKYEYLVEGQLFLIFLEVHGIIFIMGILT